MAHKCFSGDIDAIVIHKRDHVATALRDIKTSDKVYYRIGNEIKSIISSTFIPFGHKIAICKGEAGKPVLKYGETIGLATADFEVGDHVHIHNIEGIRGRGDKINLQGE
jgi:altronate dehydratase small subunit